MKEIDKVVLPGECVLIKRDETIKQTASGIFLGEDSTEKIDTGVIVKVGIKIILNEFKNRSTLSDFESKGVQGSRVRFKEVFAEPLLIDNEEYLFFRELEPSIYYYINEED